MTLEEIEALETEVLTPEIVSKVLGVNPQSIRLQAAECPERLGFNVICIGSRVKIPKIPFLVFMGREIKRPTAGTADPMPQTTGEKGQL